MTNHHLSTYLKDHRAGAEAGLEFIRLLQKEGGDQGLVAFARELEAEVEADVRDLDALMAHLGIARSIPRRATGWLAEKMAELKLRLDDPADGHLRLFETLEAISLGIEGKHSCWRALEVASDVNTSLRVLDYPRMQARARPSARASRSGDCWSRRRCSRRPRWARKADRPELPYSEASPDASNAPRLAGRGPDPGLPRPHDPRRDPKAFLGKYCVRCHGPDSQKGGVKLDDLSPDFTRVDAAEAWTGVMDQLNAGKMPPKGKPKPPREEVEAVTAWVVAGLRDAEGDRTEARLRRLSHDEYTRTIQDLLGIRYELPEDFPPDPSQHGFDNNSAALTISPIHLLKYLSVADEALEVAMGLRYRAPGSTPSHVFDPGEPLWHDAFGRHPWEVQGRKLTRAVLTRASSAT